MTVQGSRKMLGSYGISVIGRALSCPASSTIQDSWIPVFTEMTNGLMHRIRVYFRESFNIHFGKSVRT